MKKRVGDSWIPAAAYGALLPQFTVNLLVRDMERALDFYRKVLLAHVHYSDPDFAAVRILSTEMMLHTYHAYDQNPWWPRLNDGTTRGLGVELRLLGMNPEEVAERARPFNAVFKEVSARGQGWREVLIRDPDGYVWGVGVINTGAAGAGR